MSMFTHVDVTAVKISDNLVFGGIGIWVYIFEADSNLLLKKLPMLNAQKIHGIIVSDCKTRVLIFGGKQFTLMSIDKCEKSYSFNKLFEPIICSDWINSSVYHEFKVAILSAHNVVEEFDLETKKMCTKFKSEHNSIFYSGFLLPLEEDFLVFGGTVFSEVIIQRCKKKTPLHVLKGHKGVIFSICYEKSKDLIVTTSDDRSLRIWTISSKYEHSKSSTDHWESASIECHRELYGHNSRVMRCCVTPSNIISAGEDGNICFWSFQGHFIERKLCHSNSTIWAIDGNDKYIVTGGSDCAVTVHPQTNANESKIKQQQIFVEGAKKILLTARNNIVVLTAHANLVYYDNDLDLSTTVCNLKHDSSFHLMCLSPCKQIMAVTDNNGTLDVFVENCKNEPNLTQIISQKLDIGKILSMNWASNRHLVFCSEVGNITVLTSCGTLTEFYGSYILPHCKERWLTATGIDVSKNIMIVGDRCGNLHVYKKGCANPVQTFPKVHGRYGPTSIVIKDNKIVTTGRDGTIKYFDISTNNKSKLDFLNSKQFDFNWVEKFLDINENMICGFCERTFVVYDKNNRKILDVPCGGGHRSWDVKRYIEVTNDKAKEIILLIYLKDSQIHKIVCDLSTVMSKSLISGLHTKNINCLKTVQSHVNKTLFLSGGEDTLLRISIFKSDSDIESVAIFKHLSNVKTLKIAKLDDSNFLLISSGGRAQLCIKQIIISENKSSIDVKELLDYMIKGTEKARKGKKPWLECTLDFDPETRVMDLEMLKVDNDWIILTACSDAHLRIFRFKSDRSIELIKDIVHHKTCILKMHRFNLHGHNIFLTATTRGEVTFWNITNENEFNIENFLTINKKKAGINSVASILLANDQILIATGGDDNEIHLFIVRIPDQYNFNSSQILNTWTTDKFHSSQITGLILLDNYLLSASIDQRVTLFKWSLFESRVKCDFVSQICSNVADIQGMELISNESEVINLIVYGKGLEKLRIMKPK